MPFDRTIKRMQIIVKGMNEDALRALKTSDKKLSRRVLSKRYRSRSSTLAYSKTIPYDTTKC